MGFAVTAGFVGALGAGGATDFVASPLDFGVSDDFLSAEVAGSLAVFEEVVADAFTVFADFPTSAVFVGRAVAAAGFLAGTAAGALAAGFLAAVVVTTALAAAAFFGAAVDAAAFGVVAFLADAGAALVVSAAAFLGVVAVAFFAAVDVAVFLTVPVAVFFVPVVAALAIKTPPPRGLAGTVLARNLFPPGVRAGDERGATIVHYTCLPQDAAGTCSELCLFPLGVMSTAPVAPPSLGPFGPSAPEDAA